MALSLPFVVPTGYGLGKAGWVSATLPAGEEPPMDMLREWILESYRAVAPRKPPLETSRPPGLPAAEEGALQKKAAPKKTAGAEGDASPARRSAARKTAARRS